MSVNIDEKIPHINYKRSFNGVSI